MARLPKLKYVRYVTRRSSLGIKVYAYFDTGRKKDGKPIYAPMPAPSSPGFFDSYAKLNSGREKRFTETYTVAKLVAEYLGSPAYEKKAKATQVTYRLQLGKVTRSTLGKFPVDTLHAAHIQDVLDGEPTWGPATRNMFVAVIGAVYQWGRKNRKTALQPTKDIGVEKMGEYLPWPESVLRAALSADNARVRLATHLLYYTGQRIGDVCAMRWTDIHDGAIEVVQSKTSKRLEITLAEPLRAELARASTAAPTILTSVAGGKPVAQAIRTELQAWVVRETDQKVVPHGLRKNAVNALLEAGCTIAEVAAITGQTHQMVEYYAAKVDRRRLSASAMAKLENAER